MNKKNLALVFSFLTNINTTYKNLKTQNSVQVSNPTILNYKQKYN
jgi:hypothetical protein